MSPNPTLGIFLLSLSHGCIKHEKKFSTNQHVQSTKYSLDNVFLQTLINLYYVYW